MERQQQLSRVFSPRRGSAIIATVTMLGILAIVVAAMLYSVSQGARSVRDKVAYEQAYHAALSGTHVARAWMMDAPQAASAASTLYTQHTGNNAASLVTVMNNAMQMSRDIISSNYAKANFTPTQAATTWFGGGIRTLSDGRVVLYEFPDDIVRYPNDKTNLQYTNRLFTGSTAGTQSRVESLRLTTVGTSAQTSGSLREVSMIIESKGVSTIGGLKKERIIQEKVLIYPSVDGAALVGAGEAVIGGSNVVIANSANSQFNIFWAPVKAIGNVRLLNFTVNAASKTLNAGNKFYGAGLPVAAGGAGNPAFVDKWLKWQAGIGSNLIDTNGLGVFAGVGVPVTDFFSQVVAGSIPGWTTSDIQLTGGYQSAGTTLANGQNLGLWDVTNGQAGNGAFVQNSQAVTDYVNRFFNVTMEYQTIKAYAITKNGYVKPSFTGTGKNAKLSYVNQFNQPLYVTPQRQLTTAQSGNTQLTNLAQLSMDNLVPSDGNTHTNGPNKVDDRILFVDYAGGSITSPGDTVTHTINSGFFWKGVLYICGDLDAAGGGNTPTIRVKSPDDYRTDPHGTTTGFMLKNVFMDGILTVRGKNVRRGGGRIYGTLATTGEQDLNGTPDIWYNSANGAGRLKDGSTAPYAFQVLAGRIFEADSWL